MDWIAAQLRSMNAKQVGEDNWIVQKFLKIFFGISVFLHRRFKSKQKFIVIKNFDGNLKLKIDPSRSMGAAIYWTGFHELHEFLFLHKFLKKEMIAVDIGANLGEYTLFMAKRLTRGKVLSFEPMRSIRDVLAENIMLNGLTNVSVIGVGLSDREHFLQIHEVDNVHEGLNTFYLGDRKSKNFQEVPLKTLDSQIELLSVNKIDFIKIDVEGSELPALKGAVNSIRKWRPYVMVEINDLTYKAAGYLKEEVGFFFKELNYTPCTLTKQGDLVTVTTLPSFGNIIYVPN